jgi:propanol-preferring alcohol dehydrogenase
LGSLDPVHAAPLTDAGATSYHAVRRVTPRLPPGSTAIVIGAGGLGAFAIQLLRELTPARVVALDTNPARLEYARELGAHETVAGVDDGTGPELAACTGGEGAHAVLDFVGVTATITAGIGAVRPAGAFALVGAGGGTLAAPWMGGLPREADVFTFQGSNIADARDVIALAEQGRIRADVDRFTFEQIDEAYGAMDAGTLRGRAVVVP